MSMWTILRVAILLLMQFVAEGLLSVCHITLVAFGIDERILRGFFHPRQLLFHVVIGAMRAQKDIAGQTFQDTKHLFVILGDLRIRGVVDELVARIHVGAAYDDDAEGLAAACLGAIGLAAVRDPLMVHVWQPLV